MVGLYPTNCSFNMYVHRGYAHGFLGFHPSHLIPSSHERRHVYYYTIWHDIRNIKVPVNHYIVTRLLQMRTLLSPVICLSENCSPHRSEMKDT